MQKKSLLVALFCGALCLTGCLKNEESASVVQVRNAKANELNSIATLNEAKAAAELIYANADATLKGAEAELKKAEAALVLAMAETEKVRAELLKTQVALQEVKVEEEGIELLKKAAELEILLAQAEVAQAKAEAQKQYWANELEQLIADAEIAAAENALELMKAEDAIDAYILEMEGAKADSAKVYAQKYFKAQNKLVELQTAELAARAARVLIENNAMATREYIYNEIDKKNDSLAVNNAKIEALKKYLDVDPETAKVAVQKAWTELNEAYNDWQAAKTDLATAEAAQTKVNQMRALYNNENAGSPWGDQWYNDFNHEIQDLFGWDVPGGIYDEEHQINVAFGTNEKKVKAGGIVVFDFEAMEPKFIPFWQWEGVFDGDAELYPETDVVARDGSNYVELKHTYISPAKIYFDNINAALDTAIAFEGRKTAYAIDGYKKGFAEDTAAVNKTLAGLEKKIALHKEYVGVHKKAVEAAEKAYLAELEKASTYETTKAEKWEAFQKHMLLKHEESREYFIKQHEADSTYQDAVKDTLSARSAYDEAEAAVPGLYAGIQTAFETFVKAEGNYNKNVRDVLAKYSEDLEDIEGYPRINKEFADLVAAGATIRLKANASDFVDITGHVSETSSENVYLKTEGHTWGGDNAYFYVLEDENNPSSRKVYARSAQDSLQTWKYNLKVAEAQLYVASQDKVRGIPDFTTAAANYTKVENVQKALKADLDEEGAQKGDVIVKYNAAVTALQSMVTAYNNNIKPAEIAKAVAAYNPDFNNNEITKLCTFPTEAAPKAKCTVDLSKVSYDFEKEEWYTGHRPNRNYAGTAQAAFLDAVWAAYAADMKVAVAESKLNNERRDLTTAKSALYQANVALISALGGRIAWGAKFEEVEELVKEYLDDEAEELYDAYLAVKNESDLFNATIALMSAYYNYNHDEIAELQLGWWGNREEPDDNVYNGWGEAAAKKAEFGWLISSYQVDYKATMIDIAGGKGERTPIAKLFGIDVPDETEGVRPFTVRTPVVIRAEEASVPASILTPAEPTFTPSLSFQAEMYQLYVEKIAPYILEQKVNTANTELATTTTKINGIRADVNAYKATEQGYLDWIDARRDAEKDVNEAKIAEFDARAKKDVAKAEYDAAKAAADGMVWMYIPKVKDASGKWIDNPDDKDKDGFVQVSIPEAIKAIEAENEEIALRKHELELDLKYGKLTYQTVMEVLDETIEVLSADIEIWAAIANKYKAIMNAYLGIVDEGVVAEPVVEEGDEE